jgi:hypothetical protein
MKSDNPGLTPLQRLLDGSSLGDRRQDPVSEALQEIADVAALFEISEFQLFGIAHFFWYGREIPDSPLEQIFAAYMFHDVVPHWVRHLTRKVLSRYESGTLDPAEFHIHEPVASSDLRAKGIAYTILIIVVTIVFCFLIMGYVPLP